MLVTLEGIMVVVLVLVTVVRTVLVLCTVVTHWMYCGFGFLYWPFFGEVPLGQRDAGLV